MKYHILCDFRTPTSFKEKSSDHFKYVHKLKLLTDCDIGLTSSPEQLVQNAGHQVTQATCKIWLILEGKSICM